MRGREHLVAKCAGEAAGGGVGVDAVLMVEAVLHEALATAIEDDPVLLIGLTRHEWRVILAKDARGKLMDLAATDAAAVLNFVA